MVDDNDRTGAAAATVGTEAIADVGNIQLTGISDSLIEMRVSLAKIEGGFGMMKTTIGILVGAVGVAVAGGAIGVGYIGGEISDLKSEVAGINNYQKQEAAEQLSAIKESVDKLLAERVPSPEGKQPSEKPAPKK